MRTTLTLDEDLAAALKEEARRSGRPFKQVVNDALRAGIESALAPPRARRYRLPPAHLGAPAAGLDLDKTLRIADAIEDEEVLRKLELRK